MAAFKAFRIAHKPYAGVQIPKSLTKILTKSYDVKDDNDPKLTPDLINALKDYGYLSARQFMFETEEGIYMCRTPIGKSCKSGEMCLVFPYPFVVAYNATYEDLSWGRVLLTGKQA